MATSVEIPFSTPGAAAARSEVDALSRSLAGLEASQGGAARKTDAAAGALNKEAQAAKEAARQTTQAGREVEAAAGRTEGAFRRWGTSMSAGMDKATKGLRDLRQEMQRVQQAVGLFAIGSQLADVGEKLFNYSKRMSDFAAKAADLRKKSADAREEAGFKAAGTEYGLEFQLRAAGIVGTDARGLAKRATGLQGEFKAGEQFSFLETLVAGARRQGRSAEEIQSLASAGLGAFQRGGAAPGFAESYAALALAPGRRAPRDELEAQELGRQAMGLAVRRGGLTSEAESALVEGIKSGSITVSRSGRVGSVDPALAELVSKLNKSGGLAIQEAQGQGFMSLVDRDRGTVRMERGGRVGEATPDQLPGFLPSGAYAAGLRARTGGKLPTVLTGEESAAQAGGKPALLETREWIELGTAAALLALNFKSLAAIVTGAGAAIGRVFGVAAPAAAAAGAGGASMVGAAGAGTAATAGSVALKATGVAGVALSLGGSSGPADQMAWSRPDDAQFFQSPEYQKLKAKAMGTGLFGQIFGGGGPSESEMVQARAEYDARMLRAMEGIERNTRASAPATH
jgi:hypothetical protein